MARTAEGWKLKKKDTGIYHVRFTHQGRRYEPSTGTRDKTEATTRAERIYSDIVNGIVLRASNGDVAHPGTLIEDLVAKWIANIEPELRGNTPSTYMVYGGHWTRHFETLGNVTSSSIGDYQRSRLKVVSKETVTKERCGLRRFLKWLKEKEYIRAIPEFPEMNKKALGKRYKHKRRHVPQFAASKEQAMRFLSALDMRSGKHGFPVRPRFQFQWATGLRPTFVSRATWDDYLAGEGRLRIAGEFDKNGNQRTVKLSPMALEAIEQAGPAKPGEPIFGKHDYRDQVKRALEKAELPPHILRDFTPYGLKHSRVTSWLREGKSELGIQRLTGTKWALSRYIKSADEDADAIVESD